MPKLNPLQKTCLALTISQSLISTAQAATIEVDNAGDADVGCTLREAISSFNDQTLAAGCSYVSGTLAEPGTITFTNSVANSTINLAGTQLDITNNANISIQGTGVTIDGNHQSRLLNISNATVSLDSMTLTRGGFVEGDENNTQNTVMIEDATLTLSNSTLSNNLPELTYGSAMFRANRSEITIYNSSILNTPYTQNGRPVLYIADGPSVTLDQVIISNNQSSDGSTYFRNNNNVTISNSTISNNSSRNTILDFRGNDSTNLINNTISNNTARASTIRLTFEFSTFTNNTISGNSLRGTLFSPFTAGGVQLTGSSLSLINTTITNNHSPQLQISTFSNNNSRDSSVALTNTIIGNAISGPDCMVQAYGAGNSAEITSDSNSIIEDGSCNTQARSIDPLLAPLADNGGLTLTHALLNDSPAINTGDNTTCETTDQRGETRPLSAGDQCDVGAFEVINDETTTFVIPLDNGKAVIFNL